MKVTVSTVGRFHAFDLARQLLKHDHLRCLYTGYPLRKIEPDLRPHSRSFPWLVVPQMGLARYGWTSLADRISELSCNTFDRWVAAQTLDTDVLVIQSQSGLHSLRRAQARGIKTVCLRGSTHIAYQKQVLHEEYARHGITKPQVPDWALEKELQEYETADLIEVTSTFTRDSFVEYGVTLDKLFTAPLGVDLSLFHPVPKTDTTFRVLFVGMMNLRKGVQYLLEAVANLNLPNFEVVLIGSLLDEMKPIFAKYAGHFRYVGVLPRAELHRYYSQASVFVLPSIEEGFGNVQAQAMACGVPVIATTNTSASDFFTDGVEGYIIPIRSPQAIHEKILHLYHNPELRDKMAQAALRRVQSVGGWDEYGERSIQAYSRLLK